MPHRTSRARSSSRASSGSSAPQRSSEAKEAKRTRYTQEPFSARQRLLPVFVSSPRTQWIVLVCVALALYLPTLRYDFVLDDTYVIVNNTFVQRGVSGIGGILTSDALSGDTLAVTEVVLSGGRYRPLSLVMFACEVELTRALTSSSAQPLLPQQEQALSPVLFHAVSVALNACVVVVLFFTLRLWLGCGSKQPQYGEAPAERAIADALPFVAALLFAVHPIHTEVVANIKSRDELLCLLASLGALFFYLRYLAATESACRTRLLGLSALLYGCALFAKETALTMLVVFPIAAYTSSTLNEVRSKGMKQGKEFWRELWLPGLAFLSVAAIFLCVRGMVVGFSFDEPSSDILVNPFARASYSERLATAVAILLRYLTSSIFPVVMSYEYGYNQIPLVGWLHWQTVLSLVIHSALAGCALWSLKPHTATKRLEEARVQASSSEVSREISSELSLLQCVLGLSLWMYGASLSIVSNIVVNIGAPMGDRFLYMPSVGTTLLLAYGVILSAHQLHASLAHFRQDVLVFCMVLFLTAAYTVRTLVRLPAWQSQYSLRVSDVEVVPMSMRARSGAATVQMLRASELPQSAEREHLLNSAYQHLQAAIAIDPSVASEVYNNLGAYFESYSSKSNYDSAAYYYEQAARTAPRNAFYKVNALGARGLAAATRKDWDSAIASFQRAIALSTNPSSFAGTSKEALRSAAATNAANLGVVYYTQRRFVEAVRCFAEAARLNPTYPRIQEMLNAAQQAGRAAADSISVRP
jgi:tetratricopeptide (TPR) repeat protein